MKRQGDSVSDQPPVKKPDTSTDLRSKIGAKLQTLLNGINTDARLKRRQLYKDLFGKPESSTIIIDPTIVIKTEEPDIEEISNDSSTLLPSQNFLLSAKSRLTELLKKQPDAANKFKDSGKENTLSSAKSKTSSSGKSNSSQNLGCHKSQTCSNSCLAKKRNSASRRNSSSSSDTPNSQVSAKNLVVVVEDVANSENRTVFENTRTNYRKSKRNLTKKHVSNKSNVKEVNLTSNNADLIVSHSATTSEVAVMDYNKNCSSLGVVNNGIVLQNMVGCATYDDQDNSELVDDPRILPQVIMDIREDESISIDSNSNLVTEDPDADVVLLCEKARSHEVITLEDEDDVGVQQKVGEEVFQCDQCGKSFRAKSLLNFHIRMHGSDLSMSSSSSSNSFS